MSGQFGFLLRDWRGKRRMSQLDLGVAADVSARHISFLESGRANPSKPMVLRLSDSLQIPRNFRNALLAAAGYSGVYAARSLNSDELSYVRAAMQWTLERHDPFPAIAINKHWRLLKANRSAASMLGHFGFAEGESLLDSMIESSAFQSAIANWDEAAGIMAARLQTESAHLGGDQVLLNARQRLLQTATSTSAAPGESLPAIIPLQFDLNGQRLSLFSTIAQFGSAEDIVVADLRIELMFPADDETRQTLCAMASQ